MPKAISPIAAAKINRRNFITPAKNLAIPFTSQLGLTLYMATAILAA
jgi:hypothetical protein